MPSRMTECDPLRRLLAPELDRPPPPRLKAVLDALRQRHGESVRSILFYGSCRRTGTLDGLLDLYVLHDGHRRFHRRLLPALANRLLPPNVFLLRVPDGEGDLMAKVAVLSERQFLRAMRPASLDASLWARFCQPVSLLYARDPQARERAERAVAGAIRTAAWWGTRFGAPPDDPAAFWEAVFRHTYGAELRPERPGRAAEIVAHAPDWFARILPAALAGQAPAAGPRSWRLRRWTGRMFNAGRLVKAAFTFENGGDYLSWKVERHTGRPLRLTPAQRRHPLLFLPVVLLRLRQATASAPR
ncbi:hypothetical protein [Rhizosaccharibacter radicis]|uniref:Nucleotidyltransferase domain-containing protein n=1 Tax=Rhizosaccharibacter radicis TaxID=2782605 RepID=A0ABT1VV16_9PROT|nr:hypothetical protein [Acetobacteraceae bacterium KSS12]